MVIMTQISFLKRAAGCVVLGLVTFAASAQWTNPSDDIPAYNALPASKPLPAGDERQPAYGTLLHASIPGDCI